MNLPDILQYFDSYKRMGNGKYQAQCPMPDHRDSDPSVSVTQDVKTGNILLFCWGCKRRGLELAQAMGLQPSDLFGDPGHPAAVNTDGLTATEVSAEDQLALEERCAKAKENLEEASKYISSRFSLSVATGRFLGLGYDTDFGVPHLIIPFCDPTGKIVGMQGRRLVDGEPRWRSVSGGGWSKIGVFGWDLEGPVIITEGPSDALSVVGRAKLPALAIRGASNTDEYVCQQIREWIGDRPAIVIGDQGEAGERFAKEVSDGVGIPYYLPPSDYSDVSDYLADGGSLDECLETAQSCLQRNVELSPEEVDESIKQRLQDNLATAIYNEELLDELRRIPSQRRGVIFQRLVEQAHRGEIGNTRGYIRAIEQALRAAPVPRAGGGGGGVHAELPDHILLDDLPEIIWNPEDQLHVTEYSVRNAMDVYNGNHYYRAAGGRYVKVIEEDIQDLKEAGVKSMLSRMGHWRIINGQREQGHVPSDAARMIADPSWECNLPTIKRRVEVPFMLEDGEIVSNPGYHESSGVYLLPRNSDRIVVPDVPAVVTMEHINKARQIFDDVTEGFVFKDTASKSNLIAMTLTSPLRELFRANPMVPLLTSTAPQSGSGKGTSIRVPLSTVGIGPYSLATTAYNSDENEFEKKLVGKLLKKTTYIFLDNIRSQVNSSVLEQMLTAANYDGRTLGFSDVNALSTLVLWVSTLQSTGSFNRDLTRRTVPVELIKNWKGSWQHKNIDGYLADMRGDLIWACFVSARYWLQEGAPKSQVRLDGYGGWTEVVGGILEYVLCYEDFLGNLESFRKTQDQNAMTVEALLERWLEVYGEEEQPARFAVEDYDDPALHQMLNLHNPSSRQVLNALQRLLESQDGHIIGTSHMWTPLGLKPFGHEGPIRLYKCEPLPED